MSGSYYPASLTSTGFPEFVPVDLCISFHHLLDECSLKIIMIVTNLIRGETQFRDPLPITRNHSCGYPLGVLGVSKASGFSLIPNVSPPPSRYLIILSIPPTQQMPNTIFHVHTPPLPTSHPTQVYQDLF